MKMSFYFTFFITLIFLTLFSFSKAHWDSITMNPYRVLGVEPWSTMKVIRKRYKDLIRIHHPDKSHSDEGKEKFIQIQNAFESIKAERQDQEEKTVWQVLKESIRETSYLEGIYYIIIICCYLLYCILFFCLNYGIMVILVYQINEKLFPHWYTDNTTSFITALIIALIGYKMKIIPKMIKLFTDFLGKIKLSCFKDKEKVTNDSSADPPTLHTTTASTVN